MSSQKKPLVNVVKYLSPVYVQREVPTEDSIKYKGKGVSTKKDTFENWLERNSVSCDRDITRSINSAILMANGVVCNISTNEKTLLSYKGFGHPRSDYAYRIEVSVRMQPAKMSVPRILANELKSLGYVLN